MNTGKNIRKIEDKSKKLDKDFLEYINKINSHNPLWNTISSNLIRGRTIVSGRYNQDAYFLFSFFIQDKKKYKNSIEKMIFYMKIFQFWYDYGIEYYNNLKEEKIIEEINKDIDDYFKKFQK